MKGDLVHCGGTVNGEEYEIAVTRGVTFRVYDVAGLTERNEVVVEDGVIVHRVPDELNAHQARAVAAMLMEAADELERQG